MGFVSIEKEELEKEVKWKAVENAIINFLKANTKTIERSVKAKDAAKTKRETIQLIQGLSNAVRSLF